MTTTVSPVLTVEETGNRKLKLSPNYNIEFFPKDPIVQVFRSQADTAGLSVDFGIILGTVNTCKFDLGFGTIDNPCDYLTFDYGNI